MPSSEDMDAELADRMALFARLQVESFADSRGIALDYSVASMDLMEPELEKDQARIVAMPHGRVRDKAFLVTQNAYGAYAGEVIRRAGGGQWKRTDNGIGVTLPGGGIAFPFNKTAKRLDGGPADTLSGFVKFALLPNLEQLANPKQS